MSGFATSGEGSDQVVTNTGHGAIDHTAPPFSLLNGTAHNSVDHTAPPFSLLSTSAHSSLNHSAIPGINPAQVSPTERTAGSEGTLRAFSPFDVATMAGIHSQSEAQTESVATGGVGTSLSRVIPGATLAVDDESLEFLTWGRNTGGASIAVDITFGAANILSFNADSGEEFLAKGTIIRSGATAQIAVSHSVGDPSGADVGQVVNVATAAETLSGVVSLTVTGSGAGTPVIEGLIVRKWSA